MAPDVFSRVVMKMILYWVNGFVADNAEKNYFKLKCMLLNLICFNLWRYHSMTSMFSIFHISFYKLFVSGYDFIQPCLHHLHRVT